ncbi:MAG: molybdopterin-synthase adenylyltransferase MoeB [Cephaloticoccus sp.]|nr:molybdopterin-synthase adenylyltransferase MoeB [Cephaloticoccus sp.]MCF7759132.1 molybdopterin-synthase adenylyltransferase MoeB [Cephaloticoccus sp.]
MVASIGSIWSTFACEHAVWLDLASIALSFVDAATMELNRDAIRRYARHIMLPELGLEGQKKLCGSSVLCIGAGGLGSPIAMYLAAAGIGRIGIVDFDRVDESNLQRQLLHGTGDVGRPKTDSARDAIHRLNPHVEVVLHSERLTSANALNHIRPYDIVVDGTDNFPTRYLTNDACVLLRKPNVYGSIFRFEGQASVFAPHLGGPCYRCLYPEPPPAGAVPSCDEGGVLGVLPGVIGTIQSTEILKLAAGIGTPLIGRMLVYDALEMSFRELRLRRDPQCPVCGEHPTITALIDYDQFCGATPAEQPPHLHPDEVSVHDMKRALGDGTLDIGVVDIRESGEYAAAHVPGVMFLPMSEIRARIGELDPDETYYLHCRSGDRSMRLVQFLKENGFKNVKSVAGGIHAWADAFDPEMPKI